MILNGGEIKALLGAISVLGIRFANHKKPTLSEAEHAFLESADARLLAAQKRLLPDLPRDTPGWLDMLIAGQTDVSFSSDEVLTLSRWVDACLHVLAVDYRDLSALAGLWRIDGMDFLRSADAKLRELAAKNAEAGHRNR